MSASLKAWWRLRSAREQRLLLVMAALLAVTLVWLAVIRPVGDALADARARHARAVIALGEARGAADAIARLQVGGIAPPDVPLAQYLGGLADGAGFTGLRTEPGAEGEVTLVLDAVRPQAFFAFASTLERQNGLVVDRLVARPNSDATLAIRLTVRPRRR